MTRTKEMAERDALHAYAVAKRAADRAWNARVKAYQQADKADFIYQETFLKMGRTWEELTRVQRKEKGPTTKESQDRMHRQRVKELERREGMSFEELIRRAVLKEKEEK